METITSRLREERIKRGWSLTQLTVKTGINGSALSLVERGLLPCYPGWRRKLACAYELSEADLFEEESDRG